MAFIESSEWFYTICTKNEDEVLKMIKHNPDLITRPLRFSCEKNHHNRPYIPCDCGVTFEMMKSEKAFNEMVNELTSFIDKGRCMHAPVDEIRKEPPSGKAAYVAHRRGELKERTREDATVFLIHVATALGKKKIVKYILPKIVCPVREFWPMFDSKYKTNILLLSPLHLALVHGRTDMFKLIVKRCSYFLQVRSYYIEKVPELTIRQEKCLTIAAGFNSVKCLQAILQYESNVLNDSDYCEGFWNAMNTRSYQCAEILAKRIKHLNVMYDYYLKFADMVFKQDDARLFKILLSPKGVDVSFCLQRLIYHGNVNFISILLKDTEPKKFRKNIPRIPFLIQAVLHNQPFEIIKLLMVYCDADCRRCYKGYSALDWTILFGYKESERFMKTKGIECNTEAVKVYPPLIAVFDFEEIDADLHACVTRLINEGHNVNTDLINGITPFVRAMGVIGINKYRIIRNLLMNGADPFKGIAFTEKRDAFTTVNERRLICELFYCNIDVCQKDYNLYLFGRLSQDDLDLFLKYAHTISPKYKEILTHFNPKFSYFCGKKLMYIRKTIDDFLHNPRSLLIICRNSIRRYYGIKIHAFVNSQHLPCKIVNILTLKDELCLND